MKTIKGYSKKYGEHLIYVDDEDYDRLNIFKWGIRFTKNTKYARRWEVINGKVKWFHMHREILRITSDMVVDHKDHNGLNNCKENLRVCTKKENNKNKTSMVGSSSKYLGVCVYLSKEKKISKSSGEEYIYERIRIQATIRVNGRAIKIGHYKTEEEAAKAYNEYAAKYHGEFANLNKIGGRNV